MMHRCSYYAKKIITDLPYITEPIVFEILTWLPANVLVRYKVVCKLWKSWIDDPYFIDLQKRRTPRGIIGTVKDLDRVLLHSDGKNILILNRNFVRLLGASTCGLVCIKTVENKHYILNPATSKRLFLPPLMPNSCALGMRLYPNPHGRKYDVAAFCKYNTAAPNRSYYWALLTIGVDFEWKYQNFPLGAADLGPLVWFMILLCESAPFCFVKYGEPVNKMDIFKLNPHIGDGSLASAPFYLDPECSTPTMVHEWDENFAISSIVGEDISTWVLEDHKANRWRHERVSVPWIKDMRISLVQNGKMWFRKISETTELFSLDLVTKKVDKITYNDRQIYEFFSYTSTLEILEGME